MKMTSKKTNKSTDSKQRWGRGGWAQCPLCGCCYDTCFRPVGAQCGDLSHGQPDYCLGVLEPWPRRVGPPEAAWRICGVCQERFLSGLYPKYCLYCLASEWRERNPIRAEGGTDANVEPGIDH